MQNDISPFFFRFIIVGGVFIVQLRALTYFWSHTIFFRIPLSHGTIQDIWQYIALTNSMLFYISSEIILLFFGFYFVTILSIFIKSIEKLDNERFVRSSRNHLRQYHWKHLRILQKLRDLDKIFSLVKIVQTGSCLPMIVGALYHIILYPKFIVTYLTLLAVVTQLFEICLLGEFFNSKTTEIFRKLYLTKWYEMSKDDKLILHLMMRMTIYPFSVKAAGIYDINMNAFVDVIKFCFSFCALLFAMT